LFQIATGKYQGDLTAYTTNVSTHINLKIVLWCFWKTWL